MREKSEVKSALSAHMCRLESPSRSVETEPENFLNTASPGKSSSWIRPSEMMTTPAIFPHCMAFQKGRDWYWYTFFFALGLHAEEVGLFCSKLPWELVLCNGHAVDRVAKRKQRPNTI